MQDTVSWRADPTCNIQCQDRPTTQHARCSVTTADSTCNIQCHDWPTLHAMYSVRTGRPYMQDTVSGRADSTFKIQCHDGPTLHARYSAKWLIYIIVGILRLNCSDSPGCIAMTEYLQTNTYLRLSCHVRGKMVSLPSSSRRSLISSTVSVM